MRELGRMYLRGWGVPKLGAEAKRLFSAGAALGDETCKGMRASNAAEKVAQFRAAAGTGVTAGMVQLGKCYRLGRGVAKDEAEAVRLWRQAGAEGDASALSRLAECFHLGECGVTKDVDEAKRLWWLAAAQGHPSACGALKRLFTDRRGPARGVLLAEID